MEMWKRTDDKAGFEPNFAIWCRFCDADMVMRFSALFPTPAPVVGFEDAGAQIAFKCPECGYFVRFNVPSDKDYIDKIMKLRKGRKHFHDFKKLSEDERVARQLEGLGYFGGRDDKEEENG